MNNPVIADFRADASLLEGRIDISWSLTWPEPMPRPCWRLARRRRAYPVTAAEGDRVAETAHDTTDAQPWVRDNPAVKVVVDETVDPDRGEKRARVTVYDQDLEGGAVYYYALFLADPDAPHTFRGHRAWRASATATESHDLGRRLYELLPAIHHRLDEPSASDRGHGLLRRFLSVPGAAFDQVRSLGDGLRGRHDVLHVRADLLPHLAGYIGWGLDRTLDVMAQRQEILFAPELFETVGTAPNVRAQVNRLAGWDCRVKDMVHNVFRSNAPERTRLWEIWSASWDGMELGPLQSRTRTDLFDGRPTAVMAGGGWLFWHHDVGGRREIQVQSLAEQSASAYRAGLGEPPEAHPACSDESPAAVEDGERAWLFWASDRGGAWDVWGAWDEGIGELRPFEQLPDEQRRNLTAHPSHDRAPAAVRDAGGKIWLFWQSDRRGPTDIWCRVYDPEDGDWAGPRRVTRAERRHETPAAAIDGEGRIWLVFCEDLGDRRNLRVITHANGQWSSPEPLTTGRQRDESPCAVFWGGQMWIFWHSNRSGSWQILGQAWRWGASGVEKIQHEPIEVTSGPAANKEPAAVAGGDDLQLFWRSQRRGLDERSRTVDFNDEQMLARIRARSFDDRAHYTYEPGGRYARDAVGVYVTAGTEDEQVIARQRERLQAVLSHELPVNARAVLVIDPASYEAETHSGLLDGHLDRMLGWTWLHSWQDENYEDHLSVDFDQQEVSTRYRTWHAGVLSGD